MGFFKLREYGLIGMHGDYAQQVVARAQDLAHVGTLLVHQPLGVTRILKPAKVE